MVGWKLCKPRHQCRPIGRTDTFLQHTGAPDPQVNAFHVTDAPQAHCTDQRSCMRLPHEPVALLLSHTGCPCHLRSPDIIQSLEHQDFLEPAYAEMRARQSLALHAPVIRKLQSRLLSASSGSNIYIRVQLQDSWTLSRSRTM